MKDYSHIRRKCIFICSPLAGDMEANMLRARTYSKMAVDEGYAPFAPHLLYPQFLRDVAAERQAGIECGLAFMQICAEIWIFGDTISSGMRKEIDEAKKLRMTFKYFDVYGKPKQGG